MTKQVMGGPGFCTVTLRLVDVPMFPLVSVARADSTCVPALAVVVSQFTAYGGEVTALPKG
jgi:hypothetical protein